MKKRTMGYMLAPIFRFFGNKLFSKLRHFYVHHPVASLRFEMAPWNVQDGEKRFKRLPGCFAARELPGHQLRHPCPGKTIQLSCPGPAQRNAIRDRKARFLAVRAFFLRLLLGFSKNCRLRTSDRIPAFSHCFLKRLSAISNGSLSLTVIPDIEHHPPLH